MRSNNHSSTSAGVCGLSAALALHKGLLVLGLCFAGGGLHAQPQEAPGMAEAEAVHAAMPAALRTVFDSVFADMAQYHLYRQDVDWTLLRKDALNALAGRTLDSVQHLAPALQLAIDRLRDHHARFMFSQQPIAYFQNWANGRSTDARPRDPNHARAIGYAEYQHLARLLPDGVAYLRIGTVSPYIDPQAVAEHIRHLMDSVHALQDQSVAAQAPLRWIVDLRYNGGGNIFPMATAAAPLFARGAFGQTVDAQGQRIGTWRINEKGFERDGYQPARLPHAEGPLNQAWVACLVGRYTVSSGEILALGFAGRAHTRLFGEASGGYTTETNWAPYRGGLLASYAISHYAGTDGTVYHQDIPVDVALLEPEGGFPYHNGTPEALRADPVVQAALSWLKRPADDR